ncbi:hypothetical protein [Yoonia sp. BS5-3]|uniref:Uncharacterized protein n=1 Tax=Yoonia phaeophyticola TaxID=3137369 RepID=A0ABZ2VC87_9RHOB
MIRIVIFFAMSFLPTSVLAQELTVQEWLDVYIDACVGSGSVFTASGELEADGNLSLRTVRLNGALEGSVSVSKTEFRLLSTGITNSISDAAAGQASELRQCMEPLRSVLIQAMAQDLDSTNQSSVQILDPYENAVLRYVSNTAGIYGEVGQVVRLDEAIQSVTGVSGLRMQSVVNSLGQKGLLIEISLTAILEGTGNSLSLTDRGIEYALAFGLAG